MTMTAGNDAQRITANLCTLDLVMPAPGGVGKPGSQRADRNGDVFIFGVRGGAR